MRVATHRPLVAVQDRQIIRQLMRHLPHALIIQAEAGLDSAAVAQQLANAHPSEITVVEPRADKTMITTEQIRTMVAQLRTQAPQRRVIIFQPAETMTESAQNSLLKTLEEPGRHTHFILVTHGIQQLLSTIRSRCQTIVLHRTSRAQDAHLLAAANLTEQQRRQISFLAAGRPQLINQLVAQPTLRQRYQAIAADAKQLLAEPQAYQTVSLLARYSNDRQQALQLINVILTMIHFRLRQGDTSDQLQRLLEQVVYAEQLLRHHGNIRLALLQLVVY